MKFEVEEKIRPIVITLETQDEIDQMFAVCNYATICGAIPVMREIQNYYEEKDCESPAFQCYHELLKKALQGK